MLLIKLGEPFRFLRASSFSVQLLSHSQVQSNCSYFHYQLSMTISNLKHALPSVSGCGYESVLTKFFQFFYTLSTYYKNFTLYIPVPIISHFTYLLQQFYILPTCVNSFMFNLFFRKSFIF